MNRTRAFRAGKLQIILFEGDICLVTADALITAISSTDQWNGGVDQVIKRAARNMFHGQVNKARPLCHTQTLAIRSPARHKGLFGDVVFVVDDLQSPLNTIVTVALRAADRAHYKTACMPVLRGGSRLGKYEANVSEVVKELVQGIVFFAKDAPDSLHTLTIAVYNQRELFNTLAYDLERVRV